MAWQREVDIRGAYGYEGDFEEALELAARLRPGRLVAHGWDLRDYRRALEESRRAARAGRVKTVFDLRRAACSIISRRNVPAPAQIERSTAAPRGGAA